MPRNFFEFGIIVFLITFPTLGICKNIPTQERSQEKKASITFGVLYRHDIEAEKQKYQKLQDYLNQKGFTVKLEYFKDPKDIENLIDKMKSGDIDVAGELAPFDYLRFKKIVKPFARSVWNGRDFYYSVIVAKKNENIQTISDLEGKTIALSNPESTSGFIYPRSMIYEKNFDLKAKGISQRGKGENVVFYKYYGNYKNVLRAIIEGEESDIVAGSLPEFFFKEALRNNVDIANSLIILSDGRSKPIKNGVFVYRKDFFDGTVERFTAVLINLTENPPPHFFEDWKGFQGWLTWEDGDYDGLVRAMNTPSPTEKAILWYLIIVGIVVLFLSSLFVLKLMRKGER